MKAGERRHGLLHPKGMEAVLVHFPMSADTSKAEELQGVRQSYAHATASTRPHIKPHMMLCC
eukprot:scaffold166563_cov26-Tisochrysis_lutea.AAC.1